MSQRNYNQQPWNSSFIRGVIYIVIFSLTSNISVLAWDWTLRKNTLNNQNIESNQTQSNPEKKRWGSKNKQRSEQKLFGNNDNNKNSNENKFDWLKRNKNKLDEGQRSERKAAKDKLKEDKKKFKQMEKENKLLEEKQKLQNNMQQNQIKLYELNRKRTLKDKIFHKKNAGRTTSGGMLMNQ